MRSIITTTTFLGLALASLTGCPDRQIAEVNPEQGRVDYKDIPVTVNRDIDILFLIDNSDSMSDKQAALRLNFPKFIDVLNTIQGGLPNVHLGVATSDLGSKGAKDATAAPTIGTIGNGGCGNNGQDGQLQTSVAPAGEIMNKYIVDVSDGSGGRTRNYTWDGTTHTLESTFTDIATVGNKGCGFEQHLNGVRRALDPSNSVNAGFIRPSAYLAVVIVADEDDCSMDHTGTFLNAQNVDGLGILQSFRCTQFGVKCATPANSDMVAVGPRDQCSPDEPNGYMTNVDEIVTFLKGLKADPNSVIVAAIAGPPSPFEITRWPATGSPPGFANQPDLSHSCMFQTTGGTTEYADPAVRMNYFINQFPNRGTFTTICKADLSDGMTQIAELLKEVIGSPCIDGTLEDTDPNTPGIQPDCSVSDVTDPGKPDQTETILPQCNNDTTPTNTPCWSIVTDNMQCADTTSHLALKVQRGTTSPPSNDHVISNCVTVAGSGS